MVVVIMKDIDRDWDTETTTVDVECDNCGETNCVDGDNLQDCMDQLKDEGWCFKEIKGHWHDFCCQACRNEYLRCTPNEDFR